MTWLLRIGTSLLLLGIAGACALALMLALAYPRLPPLDSLTDYRPKIPLRIYTADGTLIGEFGEERRSVVRIDDVPDKLKHAILAAEDDRFFEHSGVDFMGVLRATFANLRSGAKAQGASTITMQLARNFYLSSERSYTRKLFEILLALQIETSLSKQQILEIYFNQIYLGRRSYGFASAARVYYGKQLNDLTHAEAAMLAGLPKAPSAYNPVVNPDRARLRQLYVLRRMHQLGYITDDELKTATAEQQQLRLEGEEFQVKAPYVAEMVRMMVYETYREEAYTRGLQVYTTILNVDQTTATQAVRQGVLEYDRKYGYRGPEAFVELPADPTKVSDKISDKLIEHPDNDDLYAAVVVEATPKKVRVIKRRNEEIDITGDGLRFASASLSPTAGAAKTIRRGAVVRVTKTSRGYWEIVQLPEVESAFIAVNSVDGAVRAMVGGFDFNRNKFNRVTQAWRQPGSSFKPFIYSASLEKGFTPSTLINDAPLSFDAAQTGGQPWEPKNYDGQFAGPMRMRQALAKSKNMVSIRILQSIGPRYAQEYITRFGFMADKHPPYLTMALGAGAVTPWQMAGAYAVFANGGYAINPYVISKIVDGDGKLIAQAQPLRAGENAPQAIDPRNAFIMDSLMKEVVKAGTATKAKTLGRSDLAGKTGTTNDSHDAWFAGYQPAIVAIAWMGFDQPRKLGDKETGGGLALPIWINYMSKALKGVPEMPFAQPEGILVSGGEIYYAERGPGQSVGSLGLNDPLPGDEHGDNPDYPAKSQGREVPSPHEATAREP